MRLHDCESTFSVTFCQYCIGCTAYLPIAYWLWPINEKHYLFTIICTGLFSLVVIGTSFLSCNKNYVCEVLKLSHYSSTS